MGRVRHTFSCKECGDIHYAKGYCKKHYMHLNRSKYANHVNQRPAVVPMDMDDFWEFVKKELQLG